MPNKVLSDGISGRFEYNADLFDEPMVLGMMTHFETLLMSIIIDPSLPLSALAMLPASEIDLLLKQPAARPFPRQTLHELVEDQVLRDSDRIAVQDATSHYTYGDLNTRAHALSRHLLTLGVSRGAMIGVCLDRSVDMLAALLAVLKVGAAYVPLDPNYPSERLEFMMRDTGMKHVLTQEALVSRLPTRECVKICLDGTSFQKQLQSGADIPAAVEPDDIAYVIYTSGSTGVPKGVQVSHGGVVNLLTSALREPGLDENDIMYAVTTLSFDIAAVELFLPLICGARVVLAPSEALVDGERLLTNLASSKATIMQATPATWRLLLATGWSDRLKIKILSAGEAILTELAAQLLERGTEVWNLYGPTETTIWSTLHRLTPDDDPVPIGHPVANTDIYILDRNRRLLPYGVAGELYLGGAGLARGYLDQPELTAERFVAHPWSANPKERLYRTGDLVRRRHDGAVEFLGRIDHQIKVRGFRIELGEIETVLRQHPKITDALVLDTETTDGKRLVAYLIGVQAGTMDTVEVRQWLRTKLPGHMVPATFVPLHEIPLTPNGKVDRLALPNAGVAGTHRLGIALPRTATEARIMSIWQDLLGISDVGIDDNFFDLGGHSLLAVRLLAVLGQEYGRRIPLSTLFAGATIENLARALMYGDDADVDSLLVPIRRGNGRTPLFFCHGQPRGGGVYTLKLSRYLDPDQPFYALQPHRLAGRAVPETVAQIAASYLDEVRRVQPKGPYRLGGFCYGGVIAVEMAQQLRFAAESVELLLLSHTEVPRRSRIFPIHWLLQAVSDHIGFDANQRARLYSALRDMREIARSIWRARSIPRLARPRLRLAEPSRALTDLETWLEDQFVKAGFQRKRELDPYDWAMSSYVLRPYRGKITLLRSRASCADGCDPAVGWKPWAATVEVHDAPPHENVRLEEIDGMAQTVAEIVGRLDPPVALAANS